MDFNEIAEEISILNTRVVNYNEILVETVERIKDLDMLDSKDSPCIKDQIDNLRKVVDYFKNRNKKEGNDLLKFATEIFELEKTYAKMFLNPDMIWEIRNRYPEIPNYNSSININDLYGYESLALSIKDGQVNSNISEEDLEKLEEKFDGSTTEITMSKDDLAGIIDELGLTQAQKDSLTKLVVGGIGVDTITKVLGVGFTANSDGTITLGGTMEQIKNFFKNGTKNLEATSVVKKIKELMKNPIMDSKKNNILNGSSGVVKFNNMLTALSYLNNIEDL